MEPLLAHHGMGGSTLFARADRVFRCYDYLGWRKRSDEDDASVGFQR